MMAASMAKGTTIIENAAQEPEIVDWLTILTLWVARYVVQVLLLLKSKVSKKMPGGEHTVIPDRIEAGTFLVAGAMTQGDIVVENALCEHLNLLLPSCAKQAQTIEENIDDIHVRVLNFKRYTIKTLPYPGFPMHMQAQVMAMMLYC